ncbi:MAG TPA: AAA family ATPase [Caulobacteraceae bacterium]|nr:AAA family ATPase [Caulobacteraceae bacterium]
MADVFVSYSSQDRERVIPLVEAIEQRGWSVWWDRKIDVGTAFDREIETAIDQAKCIVVVWSDASVGSDWVRSEANEGLTRGILVPVAIDQVRPPLAFRLTQTINLTPFSASIEALVEAVRRHCPPAARSGRLSPFTGRKTEFAELSERIERGRKGEGGFLLVAGEAGVGKTRLVKEGEAHARAKGTLALTGRCIQTEGAPPYQPLIEQIEQALRLAPAQNLRGALGENAPELAKLMPELRQPFPDIPEPVALPPDQERRYLLHGCGEFIDRAARMQPILLIYEDLHWASDSTCRLLRHLAERLRESPVLMVGTYRPTDLEPGQPFAHSLHELLRERLADEIVLQRLTEGDVANLLQGCAGQPPPKELVSLIFSETEGNPFFVEELYRHLDGAGKLFDGDGRFRSGVSIADTEVPRGVRLIIEHRLAKVSDDCRRVLTAAAVAGRMLPYELIRRIGELQEDPLLEAIEEAQAASLLQDVSIGRDARYQFVHEQIRQTLLGALSLPRRQRLHLRVADALEQAPAAQAAKNTGEIAFHLYQAGAAADSERTIRFLLAAAERAIDAVAFEDAMRLLDMAAEVAPEEDRTVLARIQSLRGVSLRGGARIDDAIKALSSGLALGEDVDGYVELLRQRGALYVDLYRGAEALPDLERLLAIARTNGDAALELTAQRLLADAHYKLSLDQPEHAQLTREAAERTIELARAAGDKPALARALLLTAHFVDYWSDYRPIARKHLDEAGEIARALNDEELILDHGSMSLRVALMTNAQYIERAEEILKRLEARRDPIRAKEHLFWMIIPVRNAGQLERSIEISDRAIALAARLDVPPVQYPTFKSVTLTALGRYREAWDSLAQEVTHGGYRFGAALQWFGYFSAKASLGAVREMLDETEDLLAEARALNRVWMVQAAADALTTAAARAGLQDEAAALLGRACPETQPTAMAAGWLALAQGDAEGALARAQRQQKTCRENGLLLLEADADELAAAALLALERWAEARDTATKAIGFCEATGYRNLHWRLLARRAAAHAGLGASEEARTDYAAGGSLLGALADNAPEPKYEEIFLAQPLAKQIVGGAS